MVEAGVFAPEARLELIEGEIIEMAPIGSPHAGCVNKISNLSVPQPDLALLKSRADDYARAHPETADVLLVVEVADTTLAFDLGRKATIYARCGVTELWVVDVNDRAVHVFREPGQAGYAHASSARPGQSVACAALPAIAVGVSELFSG